MFKWLLNPEDVQGRVTSNIVHIIYWLVHGQVQRAWKNLSMLLKNGFTEVELWDLGNAFARFMLPRLVAFKKMERDGFPVHYTSEEWEQVLDQMIFALLAATDDDNWDLYNREEIKSGMQILFNEVYHLWD